VLVLDKGLLSAFDKPAQKFRDMKLARFEFHKLRAVELSMPSGKCRLERRGNRWRIALPFEDTCDAAAVANLITALQEAKAERFEADDVQEAQFPLFGLSSDAPAVGKVTVELDGDTKPLEIVFGNAVLDKTDLILARNSRARSVFAVNKSIVPALDQNPMLLRSRELFSYLLTDVWKVEIKNEHPLVEVFKRPIIGWQAVLPTDYQFDPRRVDFFLMRLAEFRAEAIASEGTDDLEPFGLLVPDYRMILSLEEEVQPAQAGGGARRDPPRFVKREEILLVGVVQGPPKRAFGMIQGRPRIVELPLPVADVLARGHLNFMSLTVNEIFGSDIEHIVFLAGDKMLRVACDDNLRWRVAESKNLSAEPKGIAEAANAFRDLKAIDIAAARVILPSPYKFEEPILTAEATLRTDPPGNEKKTRKLVVGPKTDFGAYPAYVDGPDAVVYLLDRAPVEAMLAPLK
ncbi:MAG: DUF4340 domain-containing protein, partial [Planctomycetota bacterium]|nr:DUF4340 domain-containing protein [Planctomycetota bacterium]